MLRLMLSMRFAKSAQVPSCLSRIGQQTGEAGLRDQNRLPHPVIHRQNSLSACAIDLAGSQPSGSRVVTGIHAIPIAALGGLKCLRG